ncbi:MAG: hypothetical protein JNL74_20860 [Fibrobacteres bacterium]|nr:hypothetical protein [Fibrobacterota bacterium]
MPQKLTLYLKSETIRKAKTIAARNKSSVSGMVERFIDSISTKDNSGKLELTPMVKRMAGALKHIKNPDQEKYDYLMEKYS